MPDAQTVAREIITGMRDWRTANPHATLAQIEAAAEQHLDRLRVALLDEAVQASPLTDWTTDPTNTPNCPQCQRPLQARGKHSRTLIAPGDQQLTFARQYAYCPVCKVRFFPPRR